MLSQIRVGPSKAALLGIVREKLFRAQMPYLLLNQLHQSIQVIMSRHIVSINKSLVRVHRVVASHALPHSSDFLKYLRWLPIEQHIRFKLATLTHNTLCSTQPAYLHSLLNNHTPTHSLHPANTNLLSVPHVHTNFASRGFSVAAPTVGTRSHLAFATLPLPILSAAFLKLNASSRLLASPSGSSKRLRLGHWLTLCTLNIYLLTY